MVLESKENSYSNEALLKFTQGIEWDKQLYGQEIKVQLAWLSILMQNKLLSPDDAEKVAGTLNVVASQMEEGQFDWREQDEDIHMNIERAVSEAHGILGKVMHTGRSRNDLIATTLRLHAADYAQGFADQLTVLAKGLVDQAKANIDVIVPGSTHQQHGQPVLLAQILLAHAWPMLRAKKTAQEAKEAALEYMPLGAGALNGTQLSGDFAGVAEGLGFANPTLNSYDAVSDRDFLLKTLNATSQHAVHLGRLCQDVIFWASTPIGLVKLDKSWSTGSSMMPQKRNPDIAEITRAKSTRIIHGAQTASAIVHGVGTAYFSDLHELKKVYLETTALMDEIQTVWPGFISSLSFDKQVAEDLLAGGHILATDYAQSLVAKGTPFREAYQKTAALVGEAESKGEQIDPDGITCAGSVAVRNAPGGTSIEQVNKQIANIESALEA